MAARSLSTPVLVVGAGPVGAVLALELAHHGVPSVVVERALVPPRHTDVDCLNGRSMELLRRLGLAAVVRPLGADPDRPTEVVWTQGFDQAPVLMLHNPSVNEVRSRYATVNDGSAPVEPHLHVRGAALVAALRDALRCNPLVDLREGWTFTDVRMRADGVAATVLDVATGVRHLVEAAYLAGCDGAQSTVRRCLGIGMDPLVPPAQQCSVYFRSRDPVLRRHRRVFSTITANGVTLAYRDENDTWVSSLPVPADEPITVNPVALVQAQLGVDFEIQELLGVRQWDDALAVAPAYRRGPAFLAGDAAHQFHPDGCHGPSIGIGDAVDLGWKLAAATTGWGGTGLLASYELERRSLALQDRVLSAAAMETRQRFGRLAAAGASRELLAGVLEQEVSQGDNMGVHFGRRHASSPVIWHESGTPPSWNWRRITPTTWPGGRAPAVRLADGGQLFDRLGSGYTLVDLTAGGEGLPLAKQAADRGVPVTYLAVPDAAVRACWERDLVLVRPDQHIAWRAAKPPIDWPAVLDRVTGHRTT